jgi:hypothetical protein
MKNLIILALLAFSFNSLAEVGLQGRSTAWDSTGTVRTGSIESTYVNVSNVDAGSLAAGSIVVLDPTETNGYEIATSTTAGAVPHCMLQVACANGEKCKCQTYGYTEILLYDSTNSSSTAGFPIYISESTAGYAEAEVKATAAASDIPLGVFLESDTASASVKAFLRMR